MSLLTEWPQVELSAHPMRILSPINRELERFADLFLKRLLHNNFPTV